MYIKRLIFIFIVLFFVLFYSCCSFASTYEYIWSTVADTNSGNSSIAVSSDLNSGSLNLESTN